MQLEELTVTLRKPVTIGEIVYSELKLQEPTAAQLEKAASSTTAVGMVINLISAVAIVPRTVVERLGQRDFQEASDFLESFNERSPITGSTSSPN